MRKMSFNAGLIGILFLSSGGIAQSPQTRTLIVDGHPGQAPVIQANGKSWVEIETLSTLANGSLRFHGNQIILTLNAAPESQTVQQGLSRDFQQATIEAVSEIREWHSALQSGFRYQLPPNVDWLTSYRNAATKAVNLASVAATTDSDDQALSLINGLLNNMQQLTDKMLSARRNLEYVAPDTLGTDPLDKKIVACAHSLSTMAVNGQLQDDGACR